MNKFYKQPIFLQWLEAISLLILGFIPAIFIIELAFYQPLFYLLFFIYLPIGQFSFTPILTLSKVYTYYSPMLLGYMANKTQIDLHSGGSFDYLFVMSKYNPKTEYRIKILSYHLEGLLNIIQQIEDKKIPEAVEIHATSYFFNERSIKKMGFEQKEASLFYKFNLLVNFIDLTWMYSLSKGKLSFPKIWKAKKVSINGSNLLKQKEIIANKYIQLINKLNV